MAGVFPNVPGTGDNVPISTYTVGISDSYPNVNRQRIIESSINSKERVDILPVNMGINHSLNDRYIEFRVHGTVGSFIDLASLVLEMKLSLTKPDGTKLAEDINIGVVNGISNTLFKSVSLFINDKMIESNPLFNYTSYIKMLTNINSDNVDSFGKCGFFHDDANVGKVTETYTANTFTTATNIERKLMTIVKTHGIDVCFPLLFDACTLDMYLLDGVDLRIRLEMANNSWLLNSPTDVSQTCLNIIKAKLWLDRVVPHFNAIMALNEALSVKPLEYVFQKTLHKTYVIGTGQNSILIDHPFGMVIPEKMYMLIVNMNAFSGRNNLNGLYFSHGDISNILITLNGSTVYNIATDFPHFFNQSYYESLKTLGLKVDHMITHDSFKSGRSVFMFNFINEPIEEALPIETSASLRINLKLKENLTSPHVIILLAETTGLLTIDSHRTVTCDVRG